MIDPSPPDPTPPNPNITTDDFGALPIPPMDPAFFSSDPFDGDLDEFDFTFDDFDLPSDTEDFLNNPLPSSIDALDLDPICFATDPVSDVTSDGFGQVSGDNSPSPVSCEFENFLNLESTESSQGSGNKGGSNCPSPESETQHREVCEPVSSQASGNSGSAASEALNYPSPDSGNSPTSASNSENGFVDQKIKLEEEGNNCLLKRKKASEDVNSELRTSKYRRSNAVGNTDPSYGLDSTGDDEDKKKARLMRNRESAQLSRQRKKHYVEELEDKVRSMHSTIQDLNTKISYVMAENASLRQQLSGGAMCPPPPVPPPGIYPPMHMAPMGYPWMACPPYVVKPQGSQVPLVPIPRLKPQQPASAPRAKKVESNKKSEGRTKKVASVSFLGLLFFILFFGGLVPMVNVKFEGMQGRISGGSDYLGSRFYDTQRGRVLTVNGHLNGSDRNVGIGPSNGMFSSARGHVGGAKANVVKPGNSSEPLVASLYVPRNDKLVKIDGNLIIHSVMASEKAMASHQDRGMKITKETGLVVPGNLPPALGGRNNGRHPNVYTSPSEHRRALGPGSADTENLKSTVADGKLQQWFKEGLAGPMLTSGMCTEVFQFDVSPSPGAIVAASSVMNVSATRGQNSTHRLVKGRNRRILHGVPIPLAAGSRNDSNKEHMDGKPGKEDSFHGNTSLSPMVVSVLVDPREAGDGEGDGVMGPKSLSRIFVVVLIDSVKYVTYSCMLPLKGAGALI
jgi:hypothetical protein